MKVINKWKSFFVLLQGFLIFSLYFRATRGVELTDEIHNIAAIYNAANGSLPIVDSWDYHIGWFILVPFYKLFIIIRPDLEGIVLYFRIIYLVFAFISVFIISKVMNTCQNHTKYMIPWAAFFYVPFSIFQITYNSLSCWLICIISAITYSINGLHLKLSKVGVILGILMGIVCITYPTFIIAAALYNIILWMVVIDKADRLNCVISYSFTGFLLAVSFSAYLIASRGIHRFINGIYNMFNSPHEISKSMTGTFISESIYLPLRSLLKNNLIILYIYLIVLAIIWVFSKYKLNQRKKMGFITYICCILLYSQTENIAIFLFYLPLITFAYLIFCYDLHKTISIIIKNKQFMKHIVFFIAWLSFLLTYHFTSDNRSILTSIIASSTVLIVFIFFVLNKLVNRLFLLITGALLSIVFLKFDYSYVYRDDDLGLLNTKVESGIYKGLYTTPERKNMVEEIEYILKDLIPPDSDLYTATKMPYAYLMTHAKVCAPQTWDAQFLYRGFTSAMPVLEWFQTMNRYPEYILASTNEVVDFLDNPKYEINLYIEKYYELIYENNKTEIPLYLYKSLQTKS